VPERSYGPDSETKKLPQIYKMRHRNYYMSEKAGGDPDPATPSGSDPGE